MAEQLVDVCIVGAGVAGIACAQGLARQGVPALLRLGFQATVDSTLTPLHNVAIFFGERPLGTVRLDPPEGGLFYHTLVNDLRTHLDPRVDFRPGRKAVGLDPRPNGVTVVTDQGQRIACRLVVLATGDAHHLLEPLGGVYEPQAPHQTFAVAFTLEGPLGDPAAPVDSQTYHHPLPGAPIGYATFFRLGSALRANIFCPGLVDDTWQRDLKQRPLVVLADQNRLLAAATRSWRLVSPVMTRKVQVARLRPPAVPRVVVLGDAAHTIDPAGGGGLAFSLLEAELLLGVYIPHWLREDAGSPAAVHAFYSDPRRLEAVQRFFGAGRYIYALNHDSSVVGSWRRARFSLRHTLASRLNGHSAPRPLPDRPWQLPAPYLYEQYPLSGRSWREGLRSRALHDALHIGARR